MGGELVDERVRRICCGGRDPSSPGATIPVIDRPVRAPRHCAVRRASAGTLRRAGRRSRRQALGQTPARRPLGLEQGAQGGNR